MAVSAARTDPDRAIPGEREMAGHGVRSLASAILKEVGHSRAHIDTQLAHAPKNEVAAA
jgi:hypothetical protein